MANQALGAIREVADARFGQLPNLICWALEER
jgi:hypothetical protein